MNDRVVEEVYESYANDSVYTLINNLEVSISDKLAFVKVCKRAELRPLLNGVSFEISNELDCEFLVDDNDLIKVNSAILDRPVTAVFHIRHALEIVAIRSCLKVDQKEWVSAIVAFHTAVFFLEGMIRREQEDVLSNIEPWLKDAIAKVEDCHQANDTTLVVRTIAECFEHLSLYQGLPTFSKDDEVLTSIYNTAINMLAVAKPVEIIATEGGDDRLTVEAETGLNQYGCSPSPRSWANTFSSCTSSSISEYAYQEIEELRQELMLSASEGDLSSRCSEEFERIRSEISSLMMLDKVPGCEVILAPSGTDIEFYALHFAMEQNSKKAITNIVVSSTEIGGGTVQAAGGYHFNDYAPLSGSVTIGSPVDGLDTDSIRVRCLEVRDDIGELHHEDDLDDIARQFVEEELAQNRSVLLHLLDSSKTGIGAPSIDVVRELKNTYPDSIEVVVDAAQMRLGRAALHRYLNSGFMVLITGSKFFTGAPFSGGLIVPRAISNKIDKLESMPSGLAAYATRYDFPHRWRKITENLSPFPNLGLILRWQSALWEIKAFYSVSALEQFNTIYEFGQGILKIVDENKDAEIVIAPPHNRSEPELELSWDQLPSIFTFYIYKTDHSTGFRTLLSYDEARFAYRCLNMNVAKFLPVQASENEHYLAAKRCHIGQPVRIHKDEGEWVAALRIASGARIVSGIQFDYALGSNRDERLQAEIASAKMVFDKISLIVKYWDYLLEYELENGATLDASFYRF